MFTFVIQNNIGLNQTLKSLYKAHKEDTLFGRYIHNDSLTEWIKKISSKVTIKTIGNSVQNREVIALTIGKGSIKILAWSQMHGNESTTTKGVCDLVNALLSSHEISEEILHNCTIKIIPILNPDGAVAYTRVNANHVDLNRDAQLLSQPESKLLRSVFDNFKPDYCLNLHGQRTIFGAGDIGKSATVSFLSPSEDEARTITLSRKNGMNVIANINKVLQAEIPGHIGLYDDAFNINCVGDTFQSLHVPTILFEAGHYGTDYCRETTRCFIFLALVSGLHYISRLANSSESNSEIKAYLEIPNNKKNFCDIIIRNTAEGDFAIQYKEELRINEIHFIPEIKLKGNLNAHFGHREINAGGAEVTDLKGQRLQVGGENDFVLMNNEKFALKPKISKQNR